MVNAKKTKQIHSLISIYCHVHVDTLLIQVTDAHHMMTGRRLFVFNQCNGGTWLHSSITELAREGQWNYLHRAERCSAGC